MRELMERGLISETTDDSLVEELLTSPTLFYAGFDPTAPSLHVGHLLPLVLMKRMKAAGHKPIALIGRLTASIGDPSGRSEERPLIPWSEIAENSSSIQEQIGRIVGGILVSNNMNFHRAGPGNPRGDVFVVDFLRIVGQHFRVNQMIKEEPARARLESGEGLSFMEFTYKLLQAYDFMFLHERDGCTIQLGGQDQRSNIIAGIELIRKRQGHKAAGIFTPLLTDSKGNKIGKTVGGEKVWLDPEKTSSFDFYQFWIRQVDADVHNMLRTFTTIPENEIPTGKEGRERLAFEMTSLVHGELEARAARTRTRRLFEEGDQSSAEMKYIKSGVWKIAELFFVASMTKSRAEAKRLASQGGLWVNGSMIEDATKEIELRGGEHIILQVGKKKFRKVIPT